MGFELPDGFVDRVRDAEMPVEGSVAVAIGLLVVIEDARAEAEHGVPDEDDCPIVEWPPAVTASENRQALLAALANCAEAVLGRLSDPDCPDVATCTGDEIVLAAAVQVASDWADTGTLQDLVPAGLGEGWTRDDWEEAIASCHDSLVDDFDVHFLWDEDLPDLAAAALPTERWFDLFRPPHLTLVAD